MDPNTASDLTSELSDIQTINLSSELSQTRTISLPSERRSSLPNSQDGRQHQQVVIIPGDSEGAEDDSSLEESITERTPTQSSKRGRSISTQSHSQSPIPKRRRRPKDAPRISKDKYEAIMRIMKNRNVTITSLLQFIIGTQSKARQMVEDVLLDPPETARQWMDVLAIRYLESRNWSPVSSHLATELEAFGDCTRSSMQQDSGNNENDGIEYSADLWETRSVEIISSHDTQQAKSPTWLKILKDVCYNPHRPSQAVKERSNDPAFYGAILSFLAHRMRPRTYGALGKALGMFLHGCGLTRKGLEVLYSYGVVASYSTINSVVKEVSKNHKTALQRFGADPRRVVVYDNFNITDGVRHARIGDERKIWNVTSGLVKLGQSIPEIGLARTMFQPSYKLKQSDVVSIEPSQMRQDNELVTQIWHHYIASAIKKCFPDTNQVASDIDISKQDVFYQGLPVLQRPQSHKPTVMMALGPLMFNEATETGNVEILDDIYCNQFKIPLDDQQWDRKLFLHFGDAMTTARINSLKNNRRVCEGAHARMDWAMPIFGLWHLRLNLLKLIHKHHWGSINDDRSCLYHAWHSIYTKRAFDPVNFEQLHHVIVQSFQARIIALFRIQIDKVSQADRERPPGTASCSGEQTDAGSIPESNEQSRLASEPTAFHYQDAAEWVNKLPSEMLSEMVRTIWQQVSSLHRQGDQHNVICDPDADDEFQNHLHFLHNTIPYLLLTDAIRVSDIGLLRLAIKQCLLVFSGTGENYIYQRELCYYHWLISTDAAARPLQEAVLLESLVNTAGREDSYYEIDKANELLNNYLRMIKTTRRTSSLPVSVLLDRYTRLYGFHRRLADVLQKTTNTYTDGTHSEKKQLDQLWLCASNLLVPLRGHGPSIQPSPGRGSLGHTPWLLRDGMKNLAKVIEGFNAWRQNMDTGEVDDNGQPRFDASTRATSQRIHELYTIQQYRTDSGRTDRNTPTDELMNNLDVEHERIVGDGTTSVMDYTEIERMFETMIVQDHVNPAEDGELTETPQLLVLQQEEGAEHDVVGLGDSDLESLTDQEVSDHDSSDDNSIYSSLLGYDHITVTEYDLPAM